MKANLKTSVRLEIDELRQRLQEAEETLNAIRRGEVDALVVSGPSGEKVFSLEGADHAYRVLVESMSEGALTLSLEGTLLYCNAAFARLVERPLDSIMGNDFCEFVPPEDCEPLASLIERARAGHVRAEMRILGSSGRMLPAMLSLNRVHSAEDTSIGVIVTDLSERKRNEQAEADVRVRDDLLAIASHELRTPLGALVLNLTILERVLGRDAGESDMNEARKILSRARGQADQIGPLLDRLLDFSQMTSGRFKLQFTTCNFAEIIREVADRFSEQAAKAGCELRLDVSNGVVGRGDKLRLEQVFTNLVSNAIKYGAGRPVMVKLKRSGDTAVVAVEDRGIGIAPHDLDRIFERFQRTASSGFSGLGLGLYITRAIIEQHGGTIRAENRTHGGTRFLIDFPLKENRS